MDVQTQAVAVDAFDAAVVTESTSREAVASDPPPVVETPETPARVRDASGKFAKPASADSTDDFATDPEPEAAADEEPPAPEVKPAKKPRNDPQARIDQAIARQREAERRAEDAERRARDLETRQSPPAARPAPVAPTPEKFPSLQKWLDANPDAQAAEDPLSEYLDARYNHHREQERKTDAETRETQQLETTFTEKATAFSEQFATATAADPDLPSRLNQDLLTVRPFSLLTKQDKAAIRAIPNAADRDRVAFMCFLADHWIESPHAVALLEHVSDPTTFQRLATLPPSQVTRELARLEAGFGAASRTEPRGSVSTPPPTSKARPPIKPLGTTSPLPEPDGSDDESVDTYIRRENARDRKAGRL